MITLDEAIENISDLLITYRLLEAKGKKENAVLAESAQQTYDWLKLLRDIMNSGDCNTCRDQNNCPIVPQPGQQVRYNCAFFKETKSSADDTDRFMDEESYNE
jgi:hypothetical protein